MNDKSRDIFTCKNINWEALEGLFKEIRGERSEDQERDVSLPDVAAIGYHTQSCSHCRERLEELSEKYGLGKQEKSQIKKEIK